ncbi:hypothetical protein SESBI_30262 [Sesbania bispinosa]|nr:hypothetical protein SESBI_30262 [Sesbania bispinosa]
MFWLICFSLLSLEHLVSSSSAGLRRTSSASAVLAVLRHVLVDLLQSWSYETPCASPHISLA